ncbi:MAG: RNA polymerase sigma factor [Pseudomonadota bacterium]
MADAAMASAAAAATADRRRGNATASHWAAVATPEVEVDRHVSTLHLHQDQAGAVASVWSAMRSPCAANEETITTADTPRTLDGFLESVERQAYVMARRATGDEDVALDLVQEAMCRLVERYGTRDPAEWRPLFFTVLQRLITDHHRPRGVMGRLRQWFGELDNAEDATSQLPGAEPDPADVSDLETLGEAMLDALTRLPARQHQAFVLRQWQGLSVEETAAAMGVSSGSVKTHLSRALANLRSQLEEYRS